jgi:hypothetical protein
MYTQAPSNNKETTYLNLFLKETIGLLYRSLDRAPANDESCLQEQQLFSLFLETELETFNTGHLYVTSRGYCKLFPYGLSS